MTGFIKSKTLALTATAVALTFSSAANAHLVQFGWKDDGAGGVTLYGEHWHGNLTAPSTANGGITVTPVSFVGSPFTVQWTGVINNTSTADLGLTGSQCDPVNAGCDANRDWMFTQALSLGNGVYDFFTGPNCCIDPMGAPVRVTITGVTSVPPGTIGGVGGAVPEPSTWAMMLLGFGFVGGAMRSAKRRQKLTVSYA